MNRNLPLVAWVVALLFGLSALLNAFFVFQQHMIHKDLQNLTAKLAAAGQMQALVQNMTTDLVAYGQHQPAIHPVLRKYGIPVPPPPPSAPPR